MLQFFSSSLKIFVASSDHDTNKYIVRAFEENHCHKLATFCEVHRNNDAKDLSQIDAMGNYGIRPCLTYEYMVNQKRGYSKIGFTQKDMYNWIDAKRHDEAFENDSHAALIDVLVFDNTYKENDYAKPLVLLVVVNNHHTTCVFRVALLSDETVQSICGWHVSKNASTHLHKEDKKSPFRYILYKQISEDEFEELWKEMLEQHGLEENDWISRMYEKKH
ncbi:hypothetical protein Ddye_008835, partial [Dipteronia dyeriana]